MRTASVNPPDRTYQDLTAEEQQEAAATYVLKKCGVLGILLAVVQTALTRPLALLKALTLVLRLGGGAPRATLLRLCYLGEAMLLGLWMQRQDIPHLHVHFATPAATVALLTRVLFGIEFSLTVHGPDEFYDVPGYHLKEKIEAASFICAIGTYCRSQLMKLSDPSCWDKLEVAPLGVDPAVFERASAPATSAVGFRVLCIGRLVPAKGQVVLVNAIARLRREGRAVQVTIAGDGPDRARLEAVARAANLGSACRILGAVNPDAVRKLYQAADLFALPSFAEGIPVVLMEAMAMEVPCVSTTINGIPELIESGEQGLLVPPSDSAALARAIARLMDDRDLRVRLAGAGRAKVVRDYHLERNVNHLQRIFDRRIARAA